MLDIDQVADVTSRIKPPAWATPLPSGLVDFSLDEEKSRELDRHYARESAIAVQKLMGPTPQEQTQEAMRLIVRESGAGRIPDPDYDLMPRAAESYQGVDYKALALQRARDYADDLEQDLKAKGQDAYSKAERERIIANRQEEELKRLSESKATDEDRARARDERRMRLLLGQVKLKAGSSLLSDEKTSSGPTLLTG